MASNAPAVPELVELYLARGWPVFPVFGVRNGRCACGAPSCASPAKHPIPREGFKAATADASRVAEWAHRYPGCNWGIATGHAGLFVLDVDPRHGGDEALAALERVHGALPHTVRFLTGGGGQHVLFIGPDLPCSSGLVGEGLDVRGVGGYIVAPPSTHISGGAYSVDLGSWLEDTEIAAAPEWLVSAALKKRVREPLPQGETYVIEGGRNEFLTSHAGAMRRRGFDAPEILPSLLAVNARRCRPPLDEREVRRIAEGMARYAPEVAPVEPKSGVHRTADRVWRTLPELVDAMGYAGPRLETGLPTLDRALRGGFPLARTAVVGGAPGAGKTTFLLDVAMRWAERGDVLVGFLASDEAATDLMVRIGQRWGFLRDKLESRDPDEVALFRERVEKMGTLFLADADEENVTVEEFGAELARRAEGRPTVLCVDSLQTIRCEATNPKKERREQIDAVVAALKLQARTHRHLTLATSELGRGSYRSEASKEQTNDLAAFKESGGIEYGVQLGLVLRSVAGGAGDVEVTCPKNRIGDEKPSFLLSIDRRHSTVREVVQEANEAPARVATAARLIRFEKLKQRVVEQLRLTPGMSKRALHAALGGNKPNVFDAVDDLVEAGVLQRVGTGFAATLGGVQNGEVDDVG